MIPGSANPLLLASAAGGYEIERSVRFNSSDSAYLGATFGTPTDQDVFTLSMWVKRSALGSTQQLFGVSTNHSFGFTSGDALNLTFGGSSALTTTALFRDPSAWYHIMWVQNGTSHTLYVNGTSVGTATATSNTFNTAVAHQIGAGNTTNFFNGYLAYVHFIDGQAKSPSSFGLTDENGIWQPAVYSGSYGNNGFQLELDDNSTAAALGTDTSGNGNDWTVNNFQVGDYIVTNSNTPSYEVTVVEGNLGYPWYQAFDNNDATTGSFNIIYFGANGSTKPTWSTAAGVQINANGNGLTASVNGGTQVAVANGSYTTISSGSSGTIDSIQFYSPPSSGYVYGILVDGVAISVKLKNGAGNDSLVDTPTNYGTDTGAGGEVRGNYATLNPLDQSGSNTLSNGNLDAVVATGTTNVLVGTIGVSSGKFYWEVVPTAMTSTAAIIGIADLGVSASSRNYNAAGGWHYFALDGNKYNNGSGASYGDSYAVNDVIGVALDMDTGAVTFYKNGVSQGVAYNTGLAGKVIAPALNNGTNSGTQSYIINFGQRPFAYTAPSGFKALCTANLPSTTITTSGSYTGNGVADGPFVYLNGVPTAMTVGGNSVTFGTDADKLSNGFKIRTTSTTYNQNASTYNYTITSTGDPFKTARAQSN